MCVEIIYRGELIGSVGEAEAAFGEALTWAEGSCSLLGYDNSEFCICGVDIKTTAAKLGCTVETDGIDYAFV